MIQDLLSITLPLSNLVVLRKCARYTLYNVLITIIYSDDLRNFLKEAQLKEASAKATVVSEEESEESDAEPIRGDSRRSMSPRGDSHHSMSPPPRRDSQRSMSPPRRDNRMNSDRAVMLNDDREEGERGRRRRYSPRKRSVSPPRVKRRRSSSSSESRGRSRSRSRSRQQK